MHFWRKTKVEVKISELLPNLSQRVKVANPADLPDLSQSFLIAYLSVNYSLVSFFISLLGANENES
jgi:hypothetical protein